LHDYLTLVPSHLIRPSGTFFSRRRAKEMEYVLREAGLLFYSLKNNEPFFCSKQI